MALNLCCSVTGIVLLTGSWWTRNFNYLEKTFQHLIMIYFTVNEYTAVLGVTSTSPFEGICWTAGIKMSSTSIRKKNQIRMWWPVLFTCLFLHHFSAPLCAYWRLKKNYISDSAWCGCFQGKVKWQSCAEKAISQQNTFCDMQHVDDRALNVSAFPLPSHLSLGRTVLNTLTVVPVLFSPACFFCCLPRLWAGQAAAMGWTRADPWLVTSPRAATGALLCPGMSAACGGLEPPHLQQLHLEG